MDGAVLIVLGWIAVVQACKRSRHTLQSTCRCTYTVL
jgi:hypothetical protein